MPTGIARPKINAASMKTIPLRGDRTLIGERLLDDAAVVCRGCQRDGVLLTLLQQHDVQRGLDLLLAGDRHELLLLPRGVADAALELARLTVDVRLGDLETLKTLFTVVLTLRRIASMPAFMLMMAGLLSEEVRNRRLRSMIIVLYWSMTEVRF